MTTDITIDVQPVVVIVEALEESSEVIVTQVGVQGPPGPPGPVGGSALTFTFDVLATQWLVTHNTSRYPEPIIFLTGDTQPSLADVNYLSADAFTVTFNTAQTGRVEI